jgi:hypothetical protein
LGDELTAWIKGNLLISKYGNWELNSKESYSSLNELIQNPLKWLFAKLKYRNVNAPDLENESLLKGNAFHRMVEMVLSRQEFKTTHIRENGGWDEAAFQILFQSALMEKAAYLLLPEHGFRRREFARDAEECIRGLLEFLWLNKLEVVATELPFHFEHPENTPVAELKGKADLLLQTEKGEKVVLDIKWSSDSKKYQNLIKNKDASQLALYSLLYAEVRTMAYLVFPDKVVCGGNSTWNLPDSFSNSGLDFEREHAANTLLKLKKSILYRAAQLADGRIELSPGFNKEELEYPVMAVENGMISYYGDASKEYDSQLRTIKKLYQ